MPSPKIKLTLLTFSLLTGSIIGLLPSAVPAATFDPPADSAAPTQSTGGASRGVFQPPADSAAPGQATGGASRGVFQPPADSAAPGQATGGASRSVFEPPADSAAPGQATGGASRSVFEPPAGEGSPQQTAGGASRSTFDPPAGEDAPRQTTGGASRTDANGSYEFEDQVVSMMALLPDNFFGTTLMSHPTIMVYVPASPAQEAVFSIKDEEKNLHYQMTIPVSGEAGIVAVQLPEDAPALAVDQNYQWYFALKLDGELSPNTPFVDGWVKRIEPSAELAQQLDGQSLVDQSDILASNGVWYDCAAILMALQQEDPNNERFIAEWVELLDSVNLPQFTVATAN